MAQVAFNDSMLQSEGNYGGKPRVGFFSLKNNGDEAIVRIMHDSTADFDVLTTHAITVNGKHRRVNCVRNPQDPIDRCPLCAADSKIENRLYIHMIQYVKDEQGQTVPQPVVWERSLSYATQLKNLIQEYGPLSECVFKIRRNGAPGDMSTKYDIMFGNPAVYKEEFYPKCADMFENYSAIGNAVMDKNVDELNYYLQNGSFPEVKKNEAYVDTSDATPPFNEAPPTPVANPYADPNARPFERPAPQPTAAPPMGQQAPRPTRFY